MMKKTMSLVLIWLVCTACASVQAKDLSRLYEQVNPSVVVIKIIEQSISEERLGEVVTEAVLGSGVIISKDGLVLTASHVVHMASALSVTLVDGRILNARVVGSFPGADVALVQIEDPLKLVAAKLGDSDMVKTGDGVFVIGAPRGLEHTLTVGYISGRRPADKLLGNLVPIEFLQTDAAINVGNSGGPMFNMEGEVIGIVSSIVTESGGFEGIGFAAAANVARQLLLEQPTVWNGLDVVLVSGPLARALNLPQDAGLLIQRVAGGSIGEAMGLQAGDLWIETGEQKIIIGGDIILEIEDIPVTTRHEEWRRIREALAAKQDTAGVKLKILRGGQIDQLN